MPYQYPKNKGWSVPKQKYKLSNGSEYNSALCHRGHIEVWISEAAIKQWYKKKRVYDGTGTPKKYTDFAIIICHEIRKVFKQPLRQCQGFIDSLFVWQELPIHGPDDTVLSRRLHELGLKNPRYRLRACYTKVQADFRPCFAGQRTQAPKAGSHDRLWSFEQNGRSLHSKKLQIPLKIE